MKNICIIMIQNLTKNIFPLYPYPNFLRIIITSYCTAYHYPKTRPYLLQSLKLQSQQCKLGGLITTRHVN